APIIVRLDDFRSLIDIFDNWPSIHTSPDGSTNASYLASSSASSLSTTFLSPENEGVGVIA
ncbi:unnamed protein product, partial [Ceratitis capitata]